MRILVRTSKLAIWARRLALFAVTVLLISGGLHYFDQIVSSAFEVTLAIGTGLATLAFVFGIIAYIQLWFSGDKGWAPATWGILLGLLGLSPAIAAAALMQIYPSTADVTTAFDDPPELLRATPNQLQIDSETVLTSFPNLITRIYQIPPEALFAIARDLVDANGWAVVDVTEPSQADNRVTVNAMRRSLLGWENEFVFRVAASSIGAQIDLRAAAIDPVYHDLGDNGRAIENFLLALDAEVNTYIQDNLAMTDEETVEEPIAVPGAEPLDGQEADAQ